jgi:hypothetical protein
MNEPIVTYQWPRYLIPGTAGFFPLGGAAFSVSQFTGTRKTAIGGQRPWVGRIQFENVTDDDDQRSWREIRALLLRLAGTGNRLRIFDPNFCYPKGTAAGINVLNAEAPGTEPFSDDTPFDDGDLFKEGAEYCFLARDHARGEDNVLLKGLVPDAPIALAQGDEIEVGGYKHSVLANVGSDAAGMTLAPITPPLRVDILAADVAAKVNLTFASSPFLLSDTGYAGFDIKSPSIAATIQLTFEEDLP